MKMIDLKDEAIKKYISAMNACPRQRIHDLLCEMVDELDMNVSEQEIVVQMMAVANVQNQIVEASSNEQVLDIFEESIEMTLDYLKRHDVVK